MLIKDSTLKKHSMAIMYVSDPKLTEALEYKNVGNHSNIKFYKRLGIFQRKLQGDKYKNYQN